MWRRTVRVSTFMRLPVLRGRYAAPQDEGFGLADIIGEAAAGSTKRQCGAALVLMAFATP